MHPGQYSLVRSQIGFRFKSQFLTGRTFASRTWFEVYGEPEKSSANLVRS